VNDRCSASSTRSSRKLWGVLRDMQPNFFQPFDRVGIDPFTQRFPCHA